MPVACDGNVYWSALTDGLWLQMGVAVTCAPTESAHDCFLRQESEAALLTSCFYVAFTISRASGYITASYFSATTLFRGGFACGLIALLAISTASSPTGLWIGTAMFGASCAPMYPSTMALSSELFGLELRPSQLAIVGVVIKITIAAEQTLFSILIGDKDTAMYFIPCIIIGFISCGICHALMMTVGVSRAGLMKLAKK